MPSKEKWNSSWSSWSGRSVDRNVLPPSNKTWGNLRSKSKKKRIEIKRNREKPRKRKLRIRNASMSWRGRRSARLQPRLKLSDSNVKRR